jgi:hypothetical protein
MWPAIAVFKTDEPAWGAAGQFLDGLIHNGECADLAFENCPFLIGNRHRYDAFLIEKDDYQRKGGHVAISGDRDALALDVENRWPLRRQ